MSVKKQINQIEKNGFNIIKKLLKKKDCEFFKKKKIQIIKNYKKNNKKIATHNQVINNPFRHDKAFYKLIYFKKVDKILSNLIDQDYVLLNANIQNRKIDNDKTTNLKTIGDGWHTDTPSVGKKKISNGYRYLLTIMLDDFHEKNGATHFIPKSHLLKKVPKRKKKYKSKILKGKAGDAVIFDSSLWHKGGPSGNIDRFSLFSLYGPWWNKPYFDYEKMLGKNSFKKMNKKIKKLLHYNSRPPANADIRTNTIVR